MATCGVGGGAGQEADVVLEHPLVVPACYWHHQQPPWMGLSMHLGALLPVKQPGATGSGLLREDLAGTADLLILPRLLCFLSTLNMGLRGKKKKKNGLGPKLDNHWSQ